MIVESPAKAKTIEKYLGKDYTVKASYGHVRDLPKGNKAIDIDNGFTPQYEVLPDKKAIINELKKLAKTHEHILLATDEDREGEAISWHLAAALGLDSTKTQRIVFNEITKTAIVKAIQNPRSIDTNLVNAQQARRILDRLVGFKLSPILWRKIKPGLSAGRVQSVAVRLIVDREDQILAFKPESSYKVTAEFSVNGSQLQAQLPQKFKTLAEAEAFLKSCIGAEYTIAKLEKKPAKKNPSPPFTTSTLQQEASRKLSFPVGLTMRVAQQLYESGMITYMRTDSVNLSEAALKQAETAIKGEYGNQYHKKRKFKTKNAGAQEAHEAIRPTDFNRKLVTGDKNQKRLYELIWKRAIASQMAEAKLERTIVDIAISTNDKKLRATGEVLKFDGFLKVYMASTDDEPEETETKGMLPPLHVGQVLDFVQMEALQRFSKHPPRYTEASLVKKLEEQGIGRPSTYAPTISTIQKRGYAVKESKDGTNRRLEKLILAKDNVTKSHKTEVTGREKMKLFPTDLGNITTKFLIQHFPNIMNYSFTARIEKKFDIIATGNAIWNEMLKGFYTEFAAKVKHTQEHAERGESERFLGKDPKTGRDILARLGRYGPMVQLGRKEDEEKPKFAKLRSDQRLNLITLEEALELFKLPRSLGEYEGKKVSASIGRFGPYVRYDGMFVSLKEDDPYEVTLTRAIELIKAKKEADAKKLIKHFNADVQILNGRWGPYIKYHKKNVKIPKDVDPKTLTLEDCEKLFEESKNKPKRGGRGKKKK